MDLNSLEKKVLAITRSAQKDGESNPDLAWTMMLSGAGILLVISIGISFFLYSWGSSDSMQSITSQGTGTGTPALSKKAIIDAVAEYDKKNDNFKALLNERPAAPSFLITGTSTSPSKNSALPTTGGESTGGRPSLTQ